MPSVCQRILAAEAREQELCESVAMTTRPLLRQIESLQDAASKQATSWEVRIYVVAVVRSLCFAAD